MKNADQIRQLLIRAKLEVGGLSPAGICYPLYKERISIATLDEALALLPCETCNGTGKKLISGCWGMVHKEIPCPDCQKKPIDK